MKKTILIVAIGEVILFGSIARGQSEWLPLDSSWSCDNHPSSKNDADLSSMLKCLEMRDLSLGMFQATAPDQESAIEAEPTRRLRTWEMPPVTVVGESQPTLRENELIGSYAQPRWTATRRFPTTRVYVIPEGKVEVEGWARGTFKDGEQDWRFLQEVEIGLPGRFQLDLYLRQDYDSETSTTLWGGQFEIRWALADWGKIWGNPTLYFEYITLDERPDKIEPKILFGGDLGERWHWGVNLVGEFELGGEYENEYQITSGLSYSVVDSVFGVGIENIFTFANTAEDRGQFSTSYVIGPSFQYRPVPPMTINISPLFGVDSNSPDVQLWMNVGWEF